MCRIYGKLSMAEALTEMESEARAFGQWARRRYMRRHGAEPVATDPETVARFARDFAFLTREVGESPEDAPISKITIVYGAWLSGYENAPGLPLSETTGGETTEA